MNLSSLQKSIAEKMSAWHLDDFFINGRIPFFQEEFQPLLGKITLEELEELLLECYAVYYKRVSGVFYEDNYQDKLKFDDDLSDKEVLGLIQFISMSILGKEIANRTEKKQSSYHQPDDRFVMRKAYSYHYVDFFTEHCSKSEIPENWKEILQDFFLAGMQKFAGSFRADHLFIFEEKQVLVRKEIDLSPLDLSMFLALKRALTSSEDILVLPNTVNLFIADGIIASITIRKKGKLIRQFQNNAHEIFVIDKSFYHGSDSLKSYPGGSERYKLDTLYHQIGYADSRLCIRLPHGYYLLAEDYIFEFKFHATPIFSSSRTPSVVAPNISARAKIEDEEEEQDEL